MFECTQCERAFDTRRALTVHENTGHGEKWHDEETLRKHYVEMEKSSYELAAEWGCDSKTVRNWLERYGIDRREAAYYNRVEYANYKTGDDGYSRWQLYVAKNHQTSIMVHRLAAVAWHGFDEVKGMHVHHKNGVKWDNREENLDLVSPQEHIKMHQRLGDVPVGPEAQSKGGFDPSGLFIGVPNEDRYKGMSEEMENSL